MYSFAIKAFGVCNVRRRAQRDGGVGTPGVIEIETFHGFSSIVSSYHCEEKGLLSPTATQQSEVGLCRRAIAQFLQRNEAIHVARVEILDATLVKFRGKLTSIAEHNMRRVERSSQRYLKFNPCPPL